MKTEYPSQEALTPGDSLIALLQIVWRRRILVLLAGGLGACVGIAISFLVRPIYEAEATVVYASDKGQSGGLNSMIGEVGGLAALAGVNIGGLSQDRDEVLAVLESMELGRNFMDSNSIGKKILDQKWDISRIFYESKKDAYDWREAYTEFKDIRTVLPDKKTGAIRIIFQWTDGNDVSNWANAYVKFADEELRRAALGETEARLAFLQKRLESTQQVEIRSAIGRLIENELRMEMMAKSRINFALKILDPAVVPLKKSKPNRLTYALLGFVGALLLAGAYRIVTLRK